jgi:hypothetical protein
MRYFSYNEYDPNSPLSDADGGYIITVSEDDIKKTYWNYWYTRMCEKYEQSYVDENYTFEDCLEDWVIVNWAWKSKGS